MLAFWTIAYALPVVAIVALVSLARWGGGRR